RDIAHDCWLKERARAGARSISSRRTHVIPDSAARIVERPSATGEAGRLVELNEFLLHPFGEIVGLVAGEVQDDLFAVDIVHIVKVANAPPVKKTLVDDECRQLALGRVDDEMLHLAHAVPVTRDDLVPNRHLILRAHLALLWLFGRPTT